jgi:hypothetical protein
MNLSTLTTSRIEGQESLCTLRRGHRETTLRNSAGQEVQNAKEPAAHVVSIGAVQLFPLNFSKIETRPRHFH